MAEVYQADVDALSDLGHRMKNAADRMDGIRAELNAALAHNHWQGEDADAFRSQWSYRLTGLLLTAINAARAASTSLATNVDQQIQASGADGGLPGLTLGGVALGGSAFAALVDEVNGGLDTTGRIVGLGAVAGDTFSVIGAVGSKAIPDLVKGADIGAPYLLGASIGIDATRFAIDLAKNPNSDETFNAGADLAFDGLSTVAIAGGPGAVLLVDGAHALYDLGTDMDPQLTHQIVDSVGETARTIAGGVATVGGFVGGAAQGVGDFVGGGFNAISKLF